MDAEAGSAASAFREAFEQLNWRLTSIRTSPSRARPVRERETLPVVWATCWAGTFCTASCSTTWPTSSTYGASCSAWSTKRPRIGSSNFSANGLIHDWSPARNTPSTWDRLCSWQPKTPVPCLWDEAPSSSSQPIKDYPSIWWPPCPCEFARCAGCDDCPEAEARRYIRDTDKGRHDLIKSSFNQVIGDPHLYDLVINRTHTSEEEAAELIAQQCRRRFSGF